MRQAIETIPLVLLCVLARATPAWCQLQKPSGTAAITTGTAKPRPERQNGSAPIQVRSKGHACEGPCIAYIQELDLLDPAIEFSASGIFPAGRSKDRVTERVCFATDPRGEPACPEDRTARSYVIVRSNEGWAQYEPDFSTLVPIARRTRSMLQWNYNGGQWLPSEVFFLDRVRQ
jgi:hypothetical protein